MLLGAGPPPGDPAAQTAQAAAASTAAQDQATVKPCPHCGSARVSLVEIYHKAQQIPGFLLPGPGPDDTS